MDTQTETIKSANSIPFQDFCDLCEQLQKNKKNKSLQGQILQDYISNFRVKSVGIKDCSFFPVLRLLLPELERERAAYNLKELKLGQLYVKILSLHKTSPDAKNLLNFRTVKNSQHGSDFGNVAYFVLKSRLSSTGNLTIGNINDSLDKISSAEAGHKAQTLDEVFTYFLMNTSALQQMWLIRIVLKDLKLGMGHKRILSAFHPDAPEQYEACNSILKVCEELEDSETRPVELGIKLFSAVSPMLSERLDVTQAARLPQDKSYQIENKFDGERFQIHMENGNFAYYSRRGHSYTDKYGKDFESNGLLTPFLKDCFSPGIQSFILDGEMMGWHKDNQCYGSKGMSFDVKKITENSKFRPCFCAFDILYYNGRSLVGSPDKDGALQLHERLKLLDTLFNDVPGVIMHSKREIANSSADIVNALNRASNNGEEGIVVKEKESYYIVNRRNSGWYKVKPEYTEGTMEDLDLVIIGGDYAENKSKGLVNTFLLALADTVEKQGDIPKRWLSVGRAATGLSFEERERLCALLEPHWKPLKTVPAPSCLVWTKEKPELWVHPEKSFVLQVRASELIKSTDFAAGYTLRFPRIQKIREDKPLKDILSLEEFNKLVESKSAVVKLNTSLVSDENLDGGSLVMAARRKRPAKVLQVAEAFRPTRPVEALAVTSQALKGRKLCVLSHDEDCGKEELESLIRSHSGEVVQNISNNTWCCIAGRMNVRVRNAIEGQTVDVVSTTWLRELPRSETLCPAPMILNLLSATRDTQLTLARNYDNFGDSYTEDVDVETLKKCFEKIDKDEPPLFLTTDEMLKLDEHLYGGSSPFSFLRPCFIHITYTADRLAAKAKLFGAHLCNLDSPDLTHVLVLNQNKEEIRMIKEQMSRGILVSKHWLEACFLNEALLSESDFVL